MKWFSHDSNARSDVKLRKVLMRYGADGYGLYWYCLELIAGKVDASNVTFELEHDAEILAHDLKIDSLRVEEIMRFMISLDLFQVSEGAIRCMKMAKRLDERYTRSPELKAAIRQAKGVIASEDSLKRVCKLSEDSLATVDATLDNIKRNKNNGDEYAADFIDFWTHYPRKENKAQAAKAWKKLKPSPHLVSVILNDLTNRAWGDAKFIPHGGTYLNGRRWEDEQQSVPSAVGEVYR